MKTFSTGSHVWILGLAVVLACGTAAQQPLTQPSAAMTGAKRGGPKIQFKETTLDFGKASATESIKCEFVFTNSGDAVLAITDVRPGCGCTTAGLYDKWVEPGKSGRIPIQINPATLTGAVGKSVTVTCNDPGQPVVYLQVKGTVWRPIDVVPPQAYFFVTEGDTNAQSRTIRILNNQDGPITVSDLQCTNPVFRTEWKETKAGREFELSVSITPPLATPSAQCPVTLKTSSTNLPLISVLAFAMTQPAMQVIPQPFYLPPGPVQPSNHFAVTVRNNSGTNVALTEAEILVEGGTIRVNEIQPGRTFTLQFSLPAGFRIQAGQQAEVRVRTSHPRYPLIKVPILQNPSLSPVTAPGARPAGS